MKTLIYTLVILLVFAFYAIAGINHANAAEVTGPLGNVSSADVANNASLIPKEGEMRMLVFGDENYPPCKEAMSLVDGFAAKNYPIIYIEASQHRELADHLRVKELPTFIMLVGSKIIESQAGLNNGVEPVQQTLNMFENAKTYTRKTSSRRTLNTQNAPESNPHNTPDNNVLLNNASISGANRPSVVPAVGPGQNPHSPANQSLQGNNFNQQVPRFLAASVLINVSDPGGVSQGTGTIIDTRNGEALILTCGHLFRETKGQGEIEVVLFEEGQTRNPNASTIKVTGKCYMYDEFDMENDIALVSIVPPVPVNAIPVAAEDKIQTGETLISIGCDGGIPPRPMQHTVISTDRTSPQNTRTPYYYIHVSGAPTQGRSGGGLFSADGSLVGVCNTGDVNTNDGHFVPAQMIRLLLDRKKLSPVYQQPSLVDHNFAKYKQQNSAISQVSHSVNPVHRDAFAGSLGGTTSIPSDSISPSSFQDNNSLHDSNMIHASADITDNLRDESSLTPEETATIEEVRRRQAAGAEVILIVTPTMRDGSKPQSEIIKLSSVSEKFIEKLTDQNFRKEQTNSFGSNTQPLSRGTSESVNEHPSLTTQAEEMSMQVPAMNRKPAPVRTSETKNLSNNLPSQPPAVKRTSIAAPPVNK
ncbi:MAG: trypsin-like peptidase domain-containing protein [Thermoguttaceae bacterium]